MLVVLTKTLLFSKNQYTHKSCRYVTKTYILEPNWMTLCYASILFDQVKCWVTKNVRFSDVFITFLGILIFVKGIREAFTFRMLVYWLLFSWKVASLNILFLFRNVTSLKSDSHLPKKNFLLFTSMITLQKWWKMLFISS